MRYLTNVEKVRLTGSTDPHKQLEGLTKLNIPAKLRKGANGMVLDCQAFDSDAIKALGVKAWELIEDDSVGSFFR